MGMEFYRHKTHQSGNDRWNLFCAETPEEVAYLDDLFRGLDMPVIKGHDIRTDDLVRYYEKVAGKPWSDAFMKPVKPNYDSFNDDRLPLLALDYKVWTFDEPDAYRNYLAESAWQEFEEETMTMFGKACFLLETDRPGDPQPNDYINRLQEDVMEAKASGKTDMPVKTPFGTLIVMSDTARAELVEGENAISTRTLFYRNEEFGYARKPFEANIPEESAGRINDFYAMLEKAGNVFFLFTRNNEDLLVKAAELMNADRRDEFLERMTGLEANEVVRISG